MAAQDTPGDSPELAESRIDAVVAVVPPLLHALDALTHVGRHLHPTRLPNLVAGLQSEQADLTGALGDFRSLSWPSQSAGLVQPIETAAEAIDRSFAGLAAAAADPDGLMEAYRALRFAPRAAEALYPLAGLLGPVSLFFLDEAGRADEGLRQRLVAPDEPRPAEVARGGPGLGVMHANNAKHQRGGFSLYVPEYYDSETAYPVIVALHGGAGHGRAFLWTWLKQARSRGAILISPTARGGTWSLMQPEVDAANIAAILDYVGEHWNLERRQILLTGMSDGGTFAYLAGLTKAASFSHLAPISASFQPMLLQFLDQQRLQEVPIYLTHGAEDWMFPIDVARTANAALTAAGARVEYREISDLSHAYPSEENDRIVTWFLDMGAASNPPPPG